MIRLSRWRALSASMILVAAATATAPAQDDKAKDKADRLQKGEGVIVRVDPVTEEGADSGSRKERRAHRRVRLTINTAAVWRDWARDQADLASKSAAPKGKDSVGTQGQPSAPESTIVAEVGPDARVLMRYRSSTDDSNEGSRTIAAAERKDGSPESNEVKKSRRDEKAPRIEISDLKAGQFVAVEARKGKATHITVLKPVGGAQTPASEAAPKEKKKD